MIKLILILLLSGANAHQLLDDMTRRIEKAPGVQLTYELTTLAGKTPTGRTAGKMTVKGEKYTVQSQDMLVWYDGKSQWSMQPGTDEVNLIEPTAEEKRALNPLVMLKLYRAGFDMKMKEGQLTNGKKGYKIYLTAQKRKMEIREMYIEVESDLTPARLSIRQGKDSWTRIEIRSFSIAAKPQDSDFAFPASRFPDANVIDLR